MTTTPDRTDSRHSSEPIQRVILNIHRDLLRSTRTVRWGSRVLVVVLLALIAFPATEATAAYLLSFAGVILCIFWFAGEIFLRSRLAGIENLVVQADKSEEVQKWVGVYINWRNVLRKQSLYDQLTRLEPVAWMLLLIAAITLGAGGGNGSMTSEGGSRSSTQLWEKLDAVENRLTMIERVLLSERPRDETAPGAGEAATTSEGGSRSSMQLWEKLDDIEGRLKMIEALLGERP